MGAPKPKQYKQPFESNAKYGYMSQDPNNPYVKAYMNTPIETDPGVGRRSDLAEQEMENRYNSAFAGGIPEQIRQQNLDAGKRALRSEQAAESQAAEYQKNQLALQRNASLLPSLVQTGTSGYNTQLGPPQPGFLSSLLGGAGAAFGGFI